MSDYQFKLYSDARGIERELEEKQRKSAVIKTNIDMKDTNASYFRVLSRQAGLFVFPPDIKRPRPWTFNLTEGINKLIKFEKKVTKATLLQFLEKFCNPSNRTDTKKLIAEFLEELFTHHQELYETFSTVKTRLGEKQFNEIVKEELDRICESNIEKTADFDLSDEDEIREELKYIDACQDAIDNLTINNLLIDTDDTEYHLGILSPKYTKILTNINNTEGLVFCYSQFRSVEGIGIFSKVLESNGYARIYASPNGDSISEDVDTELHIGDKVRYLNDPAIKTVWKTGTISSIDSEKGTLTLLESTSSIPITSVFKTYFALWTGTENDLQKKFMLNLFNNLDNKYGKRCTILMTTSSGAEGISLMNIRQVHIMEPYWNNIRMEQVIGRARRIKSHINLEKDQQNVTIFKYNIKFTENQLSGNWGSTISKKDLFDDIDESATDNIEDKFAKEKTGIFGKSGKYLEIFGKFDGIFRNLPEKTPENGEKRAKLPKLAGIW